MSRAPEDAPPPSHIEFMPDQFALFGIDHHVSSLSGGFSQPIIDHTLDLTDRSKNTGPIDPTSPGLYQWTFECTGKPGSQELADQIEHCAKTATAKCLVPGKFKFTLEFEHTSNEDNTKHTIIYTFAYEPIMAE